MVKRVVKKTSGNPLEIRLREPCLRVSHFVPNRVRRVGAEEQLVLVLGRDRDRGRGRVFAPLAHLCTTEKKTGPGKVVSFIDISRSSVVFLRG